MTMEVAFYVEAPCVAVKCLPPSSSCIPVQSVRDGVGVVPSCMHGVVMAVALPVPCYPLKKKMWSEDQHGE
ncbi:hypothetical protein PF008_g14740 [Phytophthora fragariae]|uniref:Uncharacterized protein n=1 Tax=Phytophthora fragariae TaxID=53985 RepID=A0A6G0RH14_9STRA|nr:hypothetical protein PF008_g14740 [Phytophthora fragariae]